MNLFLLSRPRAGLHGQLNLNGRKILPSQQQHGSSCLQPLFFPASNYPDTQVIYRAHIGLECFLLKNALQDRLSIRRKPKACCTSRKQHLRSLSNCSADAVQHEFFELRQILDSA